MGPIRKVNALGMRGHISLQSIHQSCFLEDEVLHQAENGSTESIGLGSAVYSCHLCDTSTTNSICAFNQGHRKTSPPQIKGGHQTINTCTDYNDFLGHS
jgi:hypothetical protein